jgi:uncharacterized glyoxalase superfamily protein PhnB
MTDTNSARTTVTGVAPMFLVDDVERTAEWYRDALGFEIGQYFREYAGAHEHDEHGNDIIPPDGPDANGPAGPAFFVILNRDGHRLMLGKTVTPGLGVRSNTEFKEHSGDVYFWADDVEPLFAHAKAAGAHILLEPETQFYGIREFQVLDCDGRQLTFGAPVA